MKLINHDNAQKVSVYRSLGAWEYLSWLYDQVSPTHFSLVAQVTGELKAGRLEQTLHHLQQRHPLLRVRIAVDETDKAWFVEDTAAIPLRFVQRQGSQHWEREVEQELALRFVGTQAPLIRVCVVHSQNISELIVTCYHTIADGLSALYLTRDILSALTDKNAIPRLEPLPLLPHLQDLVTRDVHTHSLPVPSISDNVNLLNIENTQSQKHLQQPIFKDIDYQATLSVASHTHLCSASLSSAATQLLISHCKQQQTSVHSAICAAFLMAIYRKNCSEQSLTLKCLSPINIRSYLTPVPEEDVGVYISAAFTVNTLNCDLTLWDIARSLKEQLNQATTPEKVLDMISPSQTKIGQDSNFQENQENMTEQLSYELSVSNLGVLNIPQKFAELELQAIYGPIGLTGVKKALVVGVSTLGNQLFLVIACSELAFSSLEIEKLKKEAIKLLNLAPKIAN